jgi:hypothetical protein
MDADNLLHSRAPRPVSGIRAILEHAAQNKLAEEHLQPEGDAEAILLPQPGDPYVAHARPSVRPERTLFIMLANGDYEGFPWSSFDRISLLHAKIPGAGPKIQLRFAGSQIVDLIISGRNLMALYAYLGQNRIAWLREGHTSKPTQAPTYINCIEVCYVD